jgi:hypothetical protein
MFFVVDCDPIMCEIVYMWWCWIHMYVKIWKKKEKENGTTQSLYYIDPLVPDKLPGTKGSLCLVPTNQYWL